MQVSRTYLAGSAGSMNRFCKTYLCFAVHSIIPNFVNMPVHFGAYAPKCSPDIYSFSLQRGHPG